MSPNDSLIEIGRAYGVADFALLEGAFAAADIPLFLLHTETMRQCTHFALALGGTPICVPRSRFDEAVALLADVAPAPQARLRGWRLVAIAVLSVTFGGFAVPMSGTFPRFSDMLAENREGWR